MMAVLRARAIMFLHVSQPLRVACKSSGHVEGQAPSQLDIAPVWCRLLEEVERLIEDPSVLLRPDYNVFEGMSHNITQSIQKYRNNTTNSIMVAKVFETVESLDEETLLVLKADAMAMKVRLTSGDGGCTEFLPGGKFEHWKTDSRLREVMATVNATSDSIESVFGVIKDILKFASDNISKHSGFHLCVFSFVYLVNLVTRVFLVHLYCRQSSGDVENEPH